MRRDSVSNDERSEIQARKNLLQLAEEFEARRLFALPSHEARPHMARVVGEDPTLQKAVAELSAEGERHLRRHPRTATEIGQDAAGELGVSDDLAPGAEAGPRSALRLDRLFDDVKILQVQNAVLWMRQRDRVGGGLRRDYAHAVLAILFGLIAWLAGLATWAGAPISLFAFMVGVVLLTAGSYQWRASSWLDGGLISRDFWMSAKFAFVLLLASALSLLTLAVGPWSLSPALRFCSAVVGLVLALSAWWTLERGNKLRGEAHGPTPTPA